MLLDIFRILNFENFLLELVSRTILARYNRWLSRLQSAFFVPPLWRASATPSTRPRPGSSSASPATAAPAPSRCGSSCSGMFEKEKTEEAKISQDFASKSNLNVSLATVWKIITIQLISTLTCLTLRLKIKLIKVTCFT